MDLDELWKDVQLTKARLERIKHDAENALAVLGTILLKIEQEQATKCQR